MKKLIFLFCTLLILVVTTACNMHKNTVSFNPDGEEVTEESSDTTTEGTITTEDIKLAVTSIIGNKLETSENHHVIRGITPSNTHKLKINEYTLQKYTPGETEWSYIASTSYGTLFEGDNSFEVKAYDNDGNELGSEDFVITYNSPEIPNLPSVGTSTWMILIISTIFSTIFFGFRRLKKVFLKD